MWQAETYDPTTIDRELGWAENIGMNTMRVFLHNLVYGAGSEGIREAHRWVSRRLRRVTIYGRSLCFSTPAGIRIQNWDRSFRRCQGCTTPVGCRHPGPDVLEDPTQVPRLEQYVKGIVGTFANDSRVLAWDMWNEPDNGNDSSYERRSEKQKRDYARALAAGLCMGSFGAPTQPLTSGVWHGDWSSTAMMTPLPNPDEQSDVVSFHNYGWPEDFEAHVKMLEQFHRPLICTEYMARGAGSTFDTVLPVAHENHVGAINWGLVQARARRFFPGIHGNTRMPPIKPPIWFHDGFMPMASRTGSARCKSFAA